MEAIRPIGRMASMSVRAQMRSSLVARGGRQACLDRRALGQRWLSTDMRRGDRARCRAPTQRILRRFAVGERHAKGSDEGIAPQLSYRLPVPGKLTAERPADFRIRARRGCQG